MKLAETQARAMAEREWLVALARTLCDGAYVALAQVGGRT